MTNDTSLNCILRYAILFSESNIMGENVRPKMSFPRIVRKLIQAGYRNTFFIELDVFHSS